MKKTLLISGAVVLAITIWYVSCALTEDKSYSDVSSKYEEQLKLRKQFRSSGLASVKELRKRDRPDLAFLHDFEITKDPALGYPPSDRKLEAYRIAKEKQLKRASQKAISNVVWNERGPNNVGGRTRALMFDPNDAEAKKVWSGSVSGGLWYNNDITDPNSQWNSADDFMANLAISSIVYDPTNLSTFYLGTGEVWASGVRGAGVWKSTDSGVTWTQLASTANADFQYVQKVLITEMGTLLVASIEGLYRSVNDGEDWTTVVPDFNRFSDLEISSDGVLFASTGLNSSPGGIFKSTDDGVSWTDVSPSDTGRRIEISIAPSDPNVVYAVADRNGDGRGEIGFFVRSSDQGETWDNIRVPSYTSQDCSPDSEQFTRGQASYNLILSVNPSDPDNVIAGGIDLNRTTDGGNEWGLISYWTGSCDDYVHADQHAIVYRPGFSNEAIFGNDGGVFYSSNIDAPNPDFESRNAGYNVTQFYAVATKNEVNANYYLAGAQDNGTQQFNQAGTGKTLEASGGDGAYCFVDQNDGTYQVTSYIYNTYHHSSNGGLTFSNITSDQTTGRFINPTAYDSDAKILYSAGNSGQLMRITNIGSDTPSSQEAQSIDFAGIITHIKVSSLSENTLFVGVAGIKRIVKIIDANSTNPTVTDITGTGGGGGNVSSIDIGANEDHLLVTYSNYGVVSVFESKDGGVNWVSKEGDLPDMPVRWGIFNPNDRNEVLLATEMGVWSTDDLSADSPEWEPTNSGLANVRCDMIKYREADQQIVVATHGRGVFTSNVFATESDAQFVVDQVVGYAGSEVSFSDQSLFSNNDWLWDFGNGNNDTSEKPTNTFSVPGIYDVSLTINSGASTITKKVHILPAKATPYTLADGGDFESNPNDFAGTSLLNDDNLWELGIPTGRLSSVSSGTNAWKTDLDDNLTDAGVNQFALFTPSFDFSNAEKEYTVKFKKSIENSFCNSPFAMQMHYSLDKGKSWLILGSTEPAYGSVNWYNRGPEEGCAISPSIFENQIGWVYASLPDLDPPVDNSVDNQDTQYKLNFLAGQSSVSFRFVVGIGSSSGDPDSYDRDGFMIDDFEIEVSDPTAEFEVNNRQAAVGGQLQFSYAGSGAQTFAWDFGDGSTSDLANPTHAYTASGKYTVALTITSAAGTTTVTKTDFINVLKRYVAPYTEADGGNFDVNQDDFVVSNVAGTPLELGMSSVEGKDGTASGDFAWVTGIEEELYQDESEAILYTPTFDLSNPANYILQFKSKHKFEDNWDGFIVEYSINLGESWVKLNDEQEDGWYNQISDPASVFGVSVPIFSGNTEGEFQVFSTNISFLSPESNLMFRFLFLTDAASVDAGMALDDFTIMAEELIDAVPDFTFEGNEGCSGQRVTFTSTSDGAIDSYAWDFGSGASPATATGQGPHIIVYTASETTLSTVSLTVEGKLNGTVVEEKIGVITTALDHTPTIAEVDNNSVSTIELQASTGDSYQWYFEETVLDGSTSQSITVTDEGSYAVVVDIEGCTVTSEVFDASFETVTEVRNEIDRSISIYPNPSAGLFNLKSEYVNSNQLTINIYDLTGKKIYDNLKVTHQNSSVSKIDLSDLTQGTYMIEISSPNQSEIKRIGIK